MVITLSKAQQEIILRHAGELLEAEINADCEPSGYYLTIGIHGVYGSDATAHFGSRIIELGDVSVSLSP